MRRLGDGHIGGVCVVVLAGTGRLPAFVETVLFLRALPHFGHSRQRPVVSLAGVHERRDRSVR